MIKITSFFKKRLAIIVKFMLYWIITHINDQQLSVITHRHPPKK